MLCGQILLYHIVKMHKTNRNLAKNLCEPCYWLDISTPASSFHDFSSTTDHGVDEKTTSRDGERKKEKQQRSGFDREKKTKSG